MSDCCATEATDPVPCPSCNVSGGVVGVLPVRAHRHDATDGDWRHCATPGCAIVFYLANDVVTEDEVLTQVGLKGAAKQVPICFCFGHTAFSLAEDLAANCGASAAKNAVKAAVAAGDCGCEQLNPSGACCLVDIRRTLRTIQSTILLDTWHDPATDRSPGERTARR